MVELNVDGPHKFIVAGCNFIVWVSSVIVVGITGKFLNDYDHDQHIIFEMVIAALTLGFWLPSFVLPLWSGYKQYYSAPNFIFSYLWLTAFVFAAQDYNEAECKWNAPTTGGDCGKKLTNEAFIFLAMFFCIVAFLVDVCAWKRAAVKAAEPAAHQEKNGRPSVETA